MKLKREKMKAKEKKMITQSQKLIKMMKYISACVCDAKGDVFFCVCFWF